MHLNEETGCVRSFCNVPNNSCVSGARGGGTTKRAALCAAPFFKRIRRTLPETALFQGRCDSAEVGSQLCAECVNSRHYCDGNSRGKEAVFNGPAAGIVFQK